MSERDIDLVARPVERVEAVCGTHICYDDDLPTGMISMVTPRLDGSGSVAASGLSWPDGRLVGIDETGTAWMQHADGFVMAFRDGDCILAEQRPLGIRVT